MLLLRKISLHFVIALCISFTALNVSVAGNGDPGSVAFFYGAKPPVNALSQFDRLVLESENIKPEELSLLKQHGSSAYAYLSMGEVSPQRSWANLIKPEWTTGTNTSWNSMVMDLTNKDWQRFLLQRVDALVQQGYAGLFLDTMDSYQISATDAASRSAQQAALANLLYRIKHRHPSIRLISNRGFEVMDKIGPYLESVAAESLFSRWNNETKIYEQVPEQDRLWLAGKLSEAKRQHNIDVIAIDYVAPSDRSAARDVANKISALGFTPWVANPSLDYIGIGSLEVIPREVIMFYDSRSNGAIDESEVHRLMAMPIEYFGYVPVYHDIATKGLPQGMLKGAYAGVVIWNREFVNHKEFPKWLNKQLDDQLPMAMFGSIGTELTGELSEKLGIRPVPNVHAFSLELAYTSSMVGFEAPVPSRIDEYTMSMRNDSQLNTSYLRYKDKHGTELDTVVTGPWGGLALHPTVIDLGLDEIKDWILDPFEFLQTALQLHDAPMPDITSENGLRLWFAHIDGDAMPSWAELPGRRLGSEVIRDEIIEPYNLPHTISIVEAEMYSTNDRRELMEKTARDLFAMDNVEIATHTFSHPFDWQDISVGTPSGKYNLKVENYYFDLDREIGGSAHYIDTTLAPPGKKTKVLLWTGTALPLADAIATGEKYGLVNMNGGFTTISKATPTVTTISPNVRIVDGFTQVYAPILNENVYTNDWLGPFDGFRRVIETFDMTGFPRRIKPVNVYYHFYAGTKKASLRSLEEIYDWSMQQDVMPIFSSEYIVKVPDFRTAGVARYLDGRWKVSGLGSIKSLRTLKKNSWPDLSSSRELIGTNNTHDATYIHTNGANVATFRMKSTRPQVPHLVSANAKVNHWQRRADNSISVSFSGAIPVVVELNGDKTYCDITTNRNTVRGQLTPDGNTRFNFPTKDTGDAVIDCKT